MLVKINWQPTERQLRQFGLTAFAGLPFAGWLWSGNWMLIAVLAGIGACLAVIALVRPGWLNPVFIALSLIAAPIGIVVGEIATALIYFGMFVPIGLAFRWLGRDALQRKLEREEQSYWEVKPQPKTVESYYRRW